MSRSFANEFLHDRQGGTCLRCYDSVLAHFAVPILHNDLVYSGVLPHGEIHLAPARLGTEDI